MAHPRDTFITIYGRKPVLEALRTPGLRVEKVLLARPASGASVQAIEAAAAQHRVPVRRVPQREVTRISRNGRQDQGAVADVYAPRMRALRGWLAGGGAPTVLVLDGITSPANVGMILRTATAAGLGVVLPRAGCPEIGPLVIKASAGIAFRAEILRTPTLAEGLDHLRGADYRIFGLAGGAARSIFDGSPWEAPAAFVLGNETTGLSPDSRARLHGALTIPMAPGCDSLNVACAAAVLSYEIVRRRGTSPCPPAPRSG